MQSLLERQCADCQGAVLVSKLVCIELYTVKSMTFTDSGKHAAAAVSKATASHCSAVAFIQL